MDEPRKGRGWLPHPTDRHGPLSLCPASSPALSFSFSITKSASKLRSEIRRSAENEWREPTRAKTEIGKRRNRRKQHGPNEQHQKQQEPQQLHTRTPATDKQQRGEIGASANGFKGPKSLHSRVRWRLALQSADEGEHEYEDAAEAKAEAGALKDQS